MSSAPSVCVCALLCRGAGEGVVRGPPLRAHLLSIAASLPSSARLRTCLATLSTRLRAMCKRCVGRLWGLRGGQAGRRSRGRSPLLPSPTTRRTRRTLSASHSPQDTCTHTHSVAKARVSMPMPLAKTPLFLTSDPVSFPLRQEANKDASLCEEEDRQFAAKPKMEAVRAADELQRLCFER